MNDVRAQFRMSGKWLLTEEQARLKPLSCGSKAQDKQSVIEISEKIGALQNVFYADGEKKLLVILQGMDTSGKDGAVAGVFGRVDMLGVRCVAFKAPTQIELAHDFLWRVHQQVPAKREIVVFNRSHYEDVLVPKVQGSIDEAELKRRYAHIRDFEKLLAQSGTTILKFFLHISRDEQKERLQARLDDPEKHWKFDPHDLHQRQYWEEFRQAYQRAIAETDTDAAPWFVIPADSKTHRNLAIGSIVLTTLENMKLAYPPGDPAYANLIVE